MVYLFANFRLDPDARSLASGGLPLEVPKRVFDCLCHLVRQHQRAVGRDELIESVWHRSNVSDTQLAQTVLAVRRLLGDDGAQQRLIRTVPGFGYRFVAEVEIEPADRPAPAAAEPASIPVVANEAFAEPVPAGPERPGRGGLRSLLGLALLLALAGGSLWLWHAPAPVPLPERVEPASGWTWVLPARIDAGDEEWARIGVASLIAERLRHNGAVVVPMQNVLTRFPGAAPEALGPLRRELAAGVVVAPAITRAGETWRVELRGENASGERRVSAVDRDLLAAARRAADQLAAAPARAGESFDEGYAVITQLIRSRDFEAAHRQLARLPEALLALPETELLRIELDMEQGRHTQAVGRAAELGARLDSTRQPALVGRLGLLEVALKLHRGDPDWAAGLDTTLELLRAHGTPRDLGSALVRHAARAVIRGDYAAASTDYAQAQRQFLIAADEVGAAAAAEGLARMTAMQGRPAEGLQQLRDSIAVYARYGAVGRQFGAQRWTLSLLLGMRRWTDAESTLDGMRPLLPQLSDADERISYLRAGVMLLLSTGRLREAAALLGESEQEILGEASKESQHTADLYRMQLDLARGRHAEVAASGAQSYARVEAAGEPDAAPARDQRDMALYFWFEARRRMRAEDPRSLAPLAQAPASLESPTTIYAWLARGHRLAESGESAEAAYREALRLAREYNRLTRIVDASTALIHWLLAQDRVAEASQVLTELLVLDAGLPERDFESALLLAQVRRAEGDTAGWRQAVVAAESLAGERAIPAELLLLPPG